MDNETLKYIFFGASILTCIISFTFSEKLFEKSFFNKCAVAASVSSIMGVILEIGNFFKLETGMTFVIMSVSTIFLLYFSVLLWIFRKLKGFDPYITVGSRLGNPIIYWKDGEYKTGRKIIWEDFVFSILHGLLPAWTILFLIAYFAGRL